MMRVELTPLECRQLAHDLDGLARYLRRDGLRPLPATRALRDEIARALEHRSADETQAAVRNPQTCGIRTECSDGCVPAFRPPMVESVTTQQAATALGIGVRAVVGRLNRGTLRGQLDGRRWLVDLDTSSTPPATGPGRRTTWPLVRPATSTEGAA